MVVDGNLSANVLGIIAEYNPFHNGHLKHLQKSISLTNADYTIALISGNFVQRSEPAIIDKWARAEMALSCGVNLVLELPTIYATSAAEDFAFGAIKIFSDLKILDYISFGSKCGDIKKLETLADIFLEEPEDFIYYLNNYISEGMSYSKAINLAITDYLRSDEYSKILDDPNNILAIEYIKQIKKQQFSVTAITIKRDEDHNSENLSTYASGKAIRNAIISKKDISKSVPKTTLDILNNNATLINTLSNKAYESILFYIIRKMSIEELKNIKDVTEGIENRIKKAAYISATYDELLSNIVSKRYTKSKVKRILLNILLGITKKDMELAKKSKTYVKVLAFDEKGKKLISQIANANPKLDIIVSTAMYEKNSKSKDKKYILGKDILATDIYSLSITPFLPAGLDYTQKVVFLDNNEIAKRKKENNISDIISNVTNIKNNMNSNMNRNSNWNNNNNNNNNNSNNMTNYNNSNYNQGNNTNTRQNQNNQYYNNMDNYYQNNQNPNSLNSQNIQNNQSNMNNNMYNGYNYQNPQNSQRNVNNYNYNYNYNQPPNTSNQNNLNNPDNNYNNYSNYNNTSNQNMNSYQNNQNNQNYINNNNNFNGNNYNRNRNRNNNSYNNNDNHNGNYNPRNNY